MTGTGRNEGKKSPQAEDIARDMLRTQQWTYHHHATSSAVAGRTSRSSSKPLLSDKAFSDTVVVVQTKQAEPSRQGMKVTGGPEALTS